MELLNVTGHLNKRIFSLKRRYPTLFRINLKLTNANPIIHKSLFYKLQVYNLTNNLVYRKH
jgi:hypothetical protein